MHGAESRWILSLSLQQFLGSQPLLGLEPIKSILVLGIWGCLKKAFLATVWIIVFITLLGLISVVLGLQTGIKRLSQLNMILCGLMLSIIFIAGPTSFIVDGLLQNVGSYIQNLLAYLPILRLTWIHLGKMVGPYFIIRGGLHGRLLLDYLLQEYLTAGRSKNFYWGL